MSNLSNLFISQSFYGMVNLENSLEPLASASGDVELQDGLGDNLGLRINATTKEFTVVNNFKVDGNSDFNGDVDISGSLTHTGSIDIVGDLTIQGDVTANVGNFDTVNARLLNITEESASVIFSSGSNVLGDDETDRQDLIGQVIVSGTLGVEGNSAFTGSLTVSNEISSSTVNGIGNVTSYSASVDSRLDDLEFFSSSEYQTDSASFDNRIDQLESDTGSQDSRLDSLEAFTGSQETINGFYNQHTQSLNDFTSSQLNINSGYNTFTSSADSRLDNIEATTASLETNKLDVSVYETDSASFDNRIDNIEQFTSSLSATFVSESVFNSYTQSTDIRLNNLELETSSIDNRFNSLEAETASLQVEIDGLSNKTGSYATTGSNTFIGDNVFSGSVQGSVGSLTIASNTASIDCSDGNFFTLTLPSGSSTNLEATNIVPGLTITLQVEQPPTGSGILIFDTNYYSFPRLNQPSITPQANAIDVATFVTFDSSKLKGVLTNDVI